MLTDEQRIPLARQSLAQYISWAHRTDMSDVFDGHMIPKPHHMRMINRLQAVAPIILQQEGWRSFGMERHTVIVAPPGSAKTTILRAFYEWILGNASIYFGENWANNFHMGHISHSADQALRMSLSVRNTIDGSDTDSGPVFRLCFPDVKPSDKWAEKEWRVQGCTGLNPTLAALGIDGSIPGFRWNFVGNDDLIKPVKPSESTITPVEVDAVIYTLKRVIMKRLVEGGCAALTNTRWFELDPTSWALDQGWTQILIKALDENDKSFWEDRQMFTAVELIAERERDPEGFALQFQGEPAPEGGIKFKKEWLQQEYDQLPWVDSEDRYLNFRIVDSWDTAGTTNPHSDETAGWKAAIDIRYPCKLYLLSMSHAKLEYPELMDVLRGSIVLDPSPDFFLIEDKSTGMPAQQELEREFGKRIRPIQPYGQKGKQNTTLDGAIKQVQYMLRQGRIYFPSQRYAEAFQMDWVNHAKSSLLKYPRGHDDIARAFIQLVYETMQMEAKGEFGERFPEPGPAWKTSYKKRARV